MAMAKNTILIVDIFKEELLCAKVVTPPALPSQSTVQLVLHATARQADFLLDTVVYAQQVILMFISTEPALFVTIPALPAQQFLHQAVSLANQAGN